MNSIRLKLLAAAALLCLGPVAAEAKDKIVIGELNWDASRAIQAVFKNVLEKNYDVDVSFLAADQTVLFQGMDKGDGSVDVHPDLWMNAQEGNIDKFVREKKSVLLNDKPYATVEGLYIPGYIADEYKITTIKDLAKPELAKVFDNDGDGIGDFWPGAAGWGITNIMQVRLKSYGLDKQFKPFIVADGVFKAQLDAAYKKKKGILFYYWTPEWIHSYYDIRLLKEPEFTGYAMDGKKGTPEYNAQGCYNMLDPKTNADWLEKSTITCAQPPATVHVAYSASLARRAPNVAAFLKRVSLDPADLNQWILKIAHEKQEPAEVATIWIKENPAKVNAWIGK